MSSTLLESSSRTSAQGLQGYPIVTIADYGPNLDFATKVAVSIVQKDQ